MNRMNHKWQRARLDIAMSGTNNSRIVLKLSPPPLTMPMQYASKGMGRGCKRQRQEDSGKTAEKQGD